MAAGVEAEIFPLCSFFPCGVGRMLLYPVMGSNMNDFCPSCWLAVKDQEEQNFLAWKVTASRGQQILAVGLKLVLDSNVNLMRRMDASVSDEWNW
ncbi:hypothetical protein O6P43_002905 [Quillaja saponaria]|uniref:Uncharacterized protein n=1 Tax=Quillaja saponaria TaxID=32244 RepID=A0AAD7QDH6_QUISA|nr:hypothetical protein O6P43_002905 [Quillaja saponaria]KAJ7979514.1 hypothetical protein O6P43_002905 [Quillaja saponaria]